MGEGFSSGHLDRKKQLCTTSARCFFSCVNAAQLSVMRVFERILSDQEYRQLPHARELIHFCTQVTRNLFKRMLYTPEKDCKESTDPEPSKAPQGKEDMEVEPGSALYHLS